MGGGGDKIPGQYVASQPLSAQQGKATYLGWWGNLGSPPQKGVTVYAMSANRQNPLAGTLNAAIFNTARRTRYQILYWAPAMLLGYSTMQWAIERNEYLNSKQGRAEFGE